MLQNAINAPVSIIWLDWFYRLIRLLQEFGKPLLENFKINQYPVEARLVKRQRELQIVKYTDVINNQAAFLVLEGAIYASDSLQKRVIPKRLIKIHAVGYGCVVASE